MILWMHYRSVCHLHGYQGWYYENIEIDIPVVISWSNTRSCPKWFIIPQMIPALWFYRWWNMIWYWCGKSAYYLIIWHSSLILSHSNYLYPNSSASIWSVSPVSGHCLLQQSWTQLKSYCLIFVCYIEYISRRLPW